ncbi:MAG TPA: hypothetical protein VEQ41_07835, partial [Solirubrobacterales bacterium]|nr:hypothetical protein [Solirubrobacterales bacterium]
ELVHSRSVAFDFLLGFVELLFAFLLGFVEALARFVAGVFGLLLRVVQSFLALAAGFLGAFFSLVLAFLGGPLDLLAVVFVVVAAARPGDAAERDRENRQHGPEAIPRHRSFRHIGSSHS